VHSAQSGRDTKPQFRLVSASEETWLLAGEVDLSVSSVFAAAFAAAAALGDCIVDVKGLEFVDVAGMRAIANVAQAANASVQLRGASPALRRYWHVVGLDKAAPLVDLVA
jgi:anti-anti-sigma factor